MNMNFLCREPGFYKWLWKLSLPIILQNLITFSLGLIDTFMVSQLGNTEMAAVTAANVPVFILLSIVFGVQSGLGILVSQYWGKGDLKNINRAIGVATFIGTGMILVLAVLFFLFPVAIMDLLSAPCTGTHSNSDPSIRVWLWSSWDPSTLLGVWTPWHPIKVCSQSEHLAFLL